MVNTKIKFSVTVQTTEVKSLVTNIFICAQREEKPHTGLEQHEGEEMITKFSFSCELSQSQLLKVL